MRSHETVELNTVSAIDWARLAAFIDGEGCVRIHRRTRKNSKALRYHEYVQIHISNTDPRLMMWLQSTFGGHVVRVTSAAHRAHPEWKSSFQWHVASARASQILAFCRPYFVLKGEQADVCLAFQTTMKKSGFYGTPQSVIDRRTEFIRKIRVLNRKGTADTAASE